MEEKAIKQPFGFAIQLPLNGKLFNVLFTMTLFAATYAMRGLVDVEELGEHDKALLDEYKKANQGKKENLEEQFKLTPVVAGFIESAYPDGKVTESKGTRIFQILTDAEFKEASLPPKAELDAQLQEKESALVAAEEKIKALQAKLDKGSTKETE